MHETYAYKEALRLSNKETEERINDINMKSFSLLQAKQGAPVHTRDGVPVTILCTDARSACPIVALIHLGDGTDEIRQYHSDGRYSTYGTTGLDLVTGTDEYNLPETVYINIYMDNRGDYMSGLFADDEAFLSEEEAKDNVLHGSKLVTTAKVTIPRHP